jgi:hypothetical protein
MSKFIFGTIIFIVIFVAYGWATIGSRPECADGFVPIQDVTYHWHCVAGYDQGG